MRVLEPHQFRNQKNAKSKSVGGFVLLIFIVLVLSALSFGGYAYYKKQKPSTVVAKQTQAPVSNPEPTPQELAARPLKTFTGEEFKKLYQSVAYPNIQSILATDPPSITGNSAADTRIRQLAEAKGYRLTSIPMGAIIKINEPRLENDDLLQPLAANAWRTLKEAAIKEKVPLSLISAYRSPEYQRNLFTQRLYALGTNASTIAAGNADNYINQALDLTAVPGYSRHHTGYTLDLWCEDGSGSFVNSRCYAWINNDNYLKAKEHGWIPSYPEGTILQGPEPEPWEYVWVGSNNLR